MPAPGPNSPARATPSYDAPGAGGYAATALYCNARTQVKSSPGAVMRVNVLVAGAAGLIYDFVGTSGEATANEVAAVPAAVGSYEINFPCMTGILYVPGSGQVASISYL